MICSMEGFIFASALDLDMGYYHIKLDADAQKLRTIVFPWVKYKYIRLPMGIILALCLVFFKTSWLEGFTFASALNLSKGYYHIKLDADAQKL
jgi:hypothetical protein